MRTLIIASLPLLFLGGCVTTRAATAEERAYCEQMEREMGTQTTHDHNEVRNNIPNRMNLTHDQCRRILRQAG